MEAEEINWEDDSLKDLDLELENQALELDLEMKGGLTFKSGDMPPEIQNRFLHNVKDFEELAEASEANRPLCSLFPVDDTFPSAEQLTDQEIAAKLKEIKKVFSDNNVELGLTEKLPEKIIYSYLVEEVLPEMPSFPYGPDCQFTYVIDGCDGYCPECFQRDYCENSAAWDEEP